LSRFFFWFRNSFLRRQKRNENLSDVLEFNSEKIKKLEKLLETKLKDKSLYFQALTHRSYLETDDFNSISNERLEFLGDSVLSVIVAQYLFENYPEENEGFLTKIRAKFVNRNSLGQAADKLGIGNFLIIGNNLQRKLVNNSTAVLADAFEALIGAMFLDRGIETCREFICKILIEPHIKDDDYLRDKNYKSQLLEYTQANKISAPLYEVIAEEGPQHERVFTVRVSVDHKETGIGKGRNKKTAEQNAARISLTAIHNSG
jgi:ribonuclease-3